MVKEVQDREHWNQFLLREPTQVGLFSQSWEWLDFQEKIGHDVYRLEMENMAGICGIIRHSLPMGRSYFYSPRGPIFSHNLEAQRYHELFNECHDSIRGLDKKCKSIFWRFEPMTNLAALPRRIGGYGTAASLEATSLHTRRGRYLIAPAHLAAPVQPKQTLIVDLTQGEDKILAAMHEKTRYNIRLADRKGVRCQVSDLNNHDVEIFWKLLQETAKRDGFRSHPASYYQTMLKVLSSSSQPPLKIRGGEGGVMNTCLWLAYHNQEVVAGAIIGYFGDTVTYLHGASSYKHRALMAPYALHWQIIQEAKERSYKWYDFWGIDEKKWPGITRFKMGFGGKIIDYPGTFDLPLNKFWYKLYRVGRKIM